MSIFPAYTDFTEDLNVQSAPAQAWLVNNSFAISFPRTEEEEERKYNEIKISQPSKRCIKRRIKRQEKKRRRRERKREGKKEGLNKSIEEKERRQDIQCSEDDLFVVDKNRQLSYWTAKTLTRPLKPKYRVRLMGFFPRSLTKKKKLKNRRYFKIVDTSEGFNEGTLEEETAVSKKTEEFNKRLTDNPHDIQTWVDFVKFQDEFHKYQHIKYRSLIERERAAAQHKLSILDRAVAKNPDNKELQSLWLKIGTSVLPSEEMSARIDKILEESGGTMTLWLGLMTTTQYSLARCTAPSVTKLYEKLLVNFQKVKLPDVYGRDLNVLELLFHYGRFLENCGHWEILWLMMKVNLQFNVKVDINFDLKVDDKVKELENAVLEKEKQAVWQMWTKLEKIREALHFLPDEESIGYPQRAVSPETIVNFTWHFHPDLHFQLIVSFIILLKVPLLMVTDTVFKFLFPNALPWVFDSPEFILAAVLTSPAVRIQCDYLSPLISLVRGPQYLKRFYGQLEFFTTVNKTFEACLKCLEGRKRTALAIWWLRFQRWISKLSKLEFSCLPDDAKSPKTFFKEFLKIAENRDNLLFYVEYSLFELNQGNPETCIKTLKTIIQSKPPVLSLNDKDAKEALTSVYRTLCEVLVGADRKREALDLVINLGSGNPWDSKVTIHTLVAAEKKFESLATELLGELESETPCSLEDLLMPALAIDWISCYFWLVALAKSPAYLRDCHKKIFDALEKHTSVMAEQIRECLWETVIVIYWIFEKNNFVHSKEIVSQSFRSYPQNVRFLVFMAETDLQNNTYWWALKKTFLSNPTVFSCTFLVCLALEKFQKEREKFHNRMKNLFQSLATQEWKLSSMVHCLRLRFLLENENAHLENAQLQALESCPWNKSIYMDSILILPAKLMQLTDVLIEKELRLHITPDEIQVMRD